MKNLTHPDLPEILDAWINQIDEHLTVDLGQKLSLRYERGSIWVMLRLSTRSKPTDDKLELIALEGLEIWTTDNGFECACRYNDMMGCLLEDTRGFSV